MTGDHLSFEGNCGVRPACVSAEAGDPTVFGPSLSSGFSLPYLVLPAGVGTPRDFMAPTRATDIVLDDSLLSSGRTLTESSDNF